MWKVELRADPCFFVTVFLEAENMFKKKSNSIKTKHTACKKRGASKLFYNNCSIR